MSELDEQYWDFMGSPLRGPQAIMPEIGGLPLSSRDFSLSTQQPQKQTSKQPQKKPCTPLANNLQGTSAAGFDTFLDAFSRVAHPLDVLAVNTTMFVAAGGQIVAGGLAIGGGCLDPTPFEPLTCIAGGAAGTVSIASGTASGAFGVYFFKNYTLPAIKDWGCHE